MESPVSYMGKLRNPKVRKEKIKKKGRASRLSMILDLDYDNIWV